MNQRPVIKCCFALLLLGFECSSSFAEDALSRYIGAGEPGFHIAYFTTNNSVLGTYGIYKCVTNGYAVYLDKPWTVGDGLIGGTNERKIQVLAHRNYETNEFLQSRLDSPSCDISQLFPFDEKTAFSCEGGHWSSDYRTWDYWPRETHVFSTNEEAILVSIRISDDVYALARVRYGLTINQLFLGKIGTNIFYWETQNPRKVYWRSTDQADVTNAFSLPGRVVDIYGVTKAINTNMDVGFSTFSKSHGWFQYSPYTYEFIEASFKNAKRVKDNK